MNIDKIKNEIGIYLFDFWCNATNEQIKNAKNELKNTLENCAMNFKQQNKYVSEYFLLCSLLSCAIDLNFDKLKELRN